MSTEEKTIERLHQLLEQKEEELEAVASERDDLQRQLEFGIDWMLHKRYLGETDTLPVPRIEMTFKEMTDFTTETEAVLVLAERGSYRIRVPLGYGKRSGGRFPVEEFPTSGEISDQCYNSLPTLLHDTCKFAEQTGLPGYIVIDDTRRYRIESFRKLKIVAVEAVPVGG